MGELFLGRDGQQTFGAALGDVLEEVGQHGELVLQLWRDFGDDLLPSRRDAEQVAEAIDDQAVARAKLLLLAPIVAPA